MPALGRGRPGGDETVVLECHQTGVFKVRGGESLGGRVTEQQGMEGTGGWVGGGGQGGGVRRCFVVAGTPPF